MRRGTVVSLLLMPLLAGCGGMTADSDAGATDAGPDGPDSTLPSPDAGTDGTISPCGPSEVLCGGTCFPNDVNHCGPSCVQCGVPANGKATCDGTQCGFTCTFLQCGNSCVDPSTDQHNCGACGRDCAGTACSNATCAPELLQQDPGAYAVAVDSTNVYWTSIVGIRQSPNGGGTPLTLCPTGLAWAVSAIAVDAKYVYWPAQGQAYVYGVPIGGGNLIAFPTNGIPAETIAVDANNVYYAYPVGTPTAYAAPLDGGAARSFPMPSKMSQLEGVAVQGTDLYATGDVNSWAGVLVRAPIDGGSQQITFFDAGAFNLPLAVDPANAYIGSQTGLLEVPLDGGPSITVGSGPQALTVDSANVYWADGQGTNAIIYKAPIGGTKTTVVATAAGFVGGMAVDNQYVYYGVYTGTASGLYRVLK